MIEILHTIAGDRIEFVVSDGGERLGSCCCRLEGDYIVVEELECPNVLREGAVRAALNFAAQKRVDKARFELPAELLHSLKQCGFPINCGCIESIAAFFAVRHCGK